MINKILYLYKDMTMDEKLYNLLLALLMSLAFSIAFGHEYGRVIGGLALFVWFFIIKKEDFKKLFNSKVIIIFILLILMHFISLLWSENIGSGLNYIGSLVRYIFVPMLIIITILKPKDIKYILSAFIFGMFVNEIISYLIYFDLYDTEYSKVHRYPVGFINHIPYSVLVAFTAILILNQIKHISNKYIKVIYVLFFITMTTNLVISSGRTGYIVYFGTLIVLLFTYYRFNIKNLMYILIFPTIVFTIGYKLNEDVQKRVEASFHAVDKINKDGNYNTSFGVRLGFYPMTYNIVSQEHNSYILGVGTGDIKPEIVEFNKREKLFKKRYKHTHNSYLETYLKTGVIGLVLFIMMFVYLWREKIVDKEFIFIKQLFIISFMISMFGDHLFRTKEMMFFISIFISIIIVYGYSERKEKLE